jgi:hypothetical protein
MRSKKHGAAEEADQQADLAWHLKMDDSPLDRKQRAKERPTWAQQYLENAFRKFMDQKSTNSLNIVAADPRGTLQPSATHKKLTGKSRKGSRNIPRLR